MNNVHKNNQINMETVETVGNVLVSGDDLEMANESASSEMSESELLTEEILEDNELEYIQHSSTDVVWLQKKWFFIGVVLLVNIGCIFLVIFTKGSAYIMVPFVTLSHVRDVIYVTIAIFARVFKKQKTNWGKKTELKKGYSIKMASIVTCYTEKYETVLETCNSLYISAEKTKDVLDINVKNIVICICDGRLVGQENSEPLSDSFRKLMTPTQDPIFRKYKTWKNEEAIAMVNIGYLCDPNRIFILVTKTRNHGKKDGLIVAKKIISDINYCPSGKEKYSFHPDLKVTDPEIEEGDGCAIKYTFCCDADTAIDINCIQKCIKTMESYLEIDAAVCLLRVLFHKRSFFWDPMQHFQYFNSQFIRRGTESFFGKVTCLSGSGNICRVSSKAYKYANYHYEKYPKTTSLLDVVPKMNGTDRRYTTLMLKAKKDAKIVMLQKSYVYTETPQDGMTFISQRKRWGSNSMSNSLVNMSSRNFPWYLKLSAMVDVFRILSSYFRIMSYIWFWVYIYQVEIGAVIFVLATICLVYAYALFIIILYGDKRLVLLYGFLCNKLTSPIFTAFIFTEILFRFDDFKWGMTQKIKDGQEIDVTNLFGDDIKAKYGKNGKRKKHKGGKIGEINAVGDNDNDNDNDINDLIDDETELKEIIIEGSKTKAGKLKSMGKPYKNLRRTKGLKWIAESEKRFDDREELSASTKIRFSDPLPDVSLSENSNNSESDSEIQWEMPIVEQNPENPGETDGASFIPPPPPPPGGMIVKNNSSAAKTKRLHWKGIQRNKVKETFWENSGYIKFSLNEKEMMQLFQETNNAKVTQKEKNSFLIDFHKMHLTGVIFKKFRWSISNVVKDIVECKLDDDGIAALMTLFPLTTDETKNIKEYCNDDAKVDKKVLSVPEQFFVSIFKKDIRNIKERLECCAFKNNLSVLLTDIRGHTSMIQKACSCLKNSKKFASILRIIYKVGSILNKDSYLEHAAGFKLDILPNIKDTKTTNGENLMQYLVKNLARQKPKLLSFAKEIKYVVPASKISIGSVNQLWEFIETNMKLLQSEIDRTKNVTDNDADKIFFREFSSFLELAVEQVKFEKRFLQNALDMFKKITMFYGEDADKTITTEEFFGVIVTFINDFDFASLKYMQSQETQSQSQSQQSTSQLIHDQDKTQKIPAKTVVI